MTDPIARAEALLEQWGPRPDAAEVHDAMSALVEECKRLRDTRIEWQCEAPSAAGRILALEAENADLRRKLGNMCDWVNLGNGVIKRVDD